MRFKEWPSLGRVKGWGPTRHRDLPEVTPQSWAMFTPDSPSCFSFIVCTLAAAAGGWGGSQDWLALGLPPRLDLPGVCKGIT